MIAVCSGKGELRATIQKFWRPAWKFAANPKNCHMGGGKLAAEGGQLWTSLTTAKPGPQDLLFITALFLEHSKGTLRAHGGLLFHWTGGSAALSGSFLLTSGPLDVQLQPKRVSHGLLNGQFGGLEAVLRPLLKDKVGLHAFRAHTQKLGLPEIGSRPLAVMQGHEEIFLPLRGLQVGLHDPKTWVKKKHKK